MRAMTHNSRTNAAGSVHGSKHNDRNFDVSLASNIRESESGKNIYWSWNKAETFEQSEIDYYNLAFTKQLEKTNQRYRANGHPERCRTIEQFMQVRQNAPEETVLQVGKMEESIDSSLLKDIFNTWFKQLQRWNEEHGKPFQILDAALHVDEAVPHVQMRKVWQYTDPDGDLRVGQEKALEAAGVSLPDPDKKPSRYNNRKQTFDAMTRKMWLDICAEKGLDIERDPLPDGLHNLDKEDMIREKYRKLGAEIETAQKNLNALETSLNARRIDSEALDDEISVKTSQIGKYEAQIGKYETQLSTYEVQIGNYEQIESFILRVEAKLREWIDSIIDSIETIFRKFERDDTSENVVSARSLEQAGISVDMKNKDYGFLYLNDQRIEYDGYPLLVYRTRSGFIRDSLVEFDASGKAINFHSDSKFLNEHLNAAHRDFDIAPIETNAVAKLLQTLEEAEKARKLIENAQDNNKTLKSRDRAR